MRRSEVATIVLEEIEIPSCYQGGVHADIGADMLDGPFVPTTEVRLITSSGRRRGSLV